MKAKFFKNPKQFRDWLNKNHNKKKELWVGYYKKSSGKKGMGYLEAVDVALCFGWIDGVAKSLNNLSHTNRFTPRKPKSIWSVRNLGRIKELKKLGLMHPAGLKVFNERDKTRTGLYSFEQKSVKFDLATEQKIKKHKQAWNFFKLQPPGYQRLATWWVISAKKAETKNKRISRLIADSRMRRRLPMFA